MLLKIALSIAIVFVLAVPCFAQGEKTTRPVELEVLKAYVGVWDAEFEVWPQGPDSPSMKFKGVETNRAFGEHWIASDLESEFMGQTMKIHSIIGYDLDQKKMIGTIVDHGPYAAKMTGDYDEKSKSVTWMTEAKNLDGSPIIQKTVITEKSADERLLVLMVPAEKEGEFNKMMEVKFVKRK